ncbi:MAG TPA: penicillin-binding protein 2, partial [Terriglobales bacterium]|nr:penicillin-binding protein 2 [Terriglobales bacterium]
MARDEKVSQFRLAGVQYAILGIFLLLAFGLWRLQILGNDYYASLAEKNKIREVPILAPRGKILDREGRIIVDNYPSFSALLLRDQTRNLMADAPAIAAGLHMDEKDVRDRIHKFASAPQYQPIFLKDDITPDELSFIEAHRNELPELDTIMIHRRLYPKDGFLAHLIGYVGEVSEDMLSQPQWEFYNAGDIVGKSGAELEYNDILMGKNGSRRALVNSRGKEIGRLDETPAIPGKPLKLTIDLDMQIAAEEAMQGKNGAIVAMDPRNGEILAMVSRPTFDPNAFAVRIERDDWAKLVEDDEHPLMNKAIQAQLAPGSTFKIIMAAAGLQEGIAQDMHVNCSGGASFYGRYFKCWVVADHRVHGMVDITKAIYQSCDVFFYTLAEKLGIDRIAQYADEFGLGHKTGIDLPNEMSGVMPSEEWKIRNFKQKWYAGETISVGIGQGAVAATPIQMTRALGGIASQGVLQRPHIAFPDELAQYGLKLASSVPQEKRVALDEKNWDIITDAMALVPTPEGTSGSAHLEGIDFAGKTGSAQTMSNALAQRLGFKHSMKDNAWFVGFTPRRNPEIVVGVLFEGGEHGQFAARIASQVIRAYVQKQRARENKIAYAPALKAAPGLENVPVASPAVLAALRDHDPALDRQDRTELAQLGSQPEGTASAVPHSGSTEAARAAAGHKPPAASAADDRIEMSGFWNSGGSDELHANRYII